MKDSVLACNGMDKAEGALAREIGMRVAEATEGAIVCPVLLNRASDRYEKVLTAASLIVIDGCGTRCASRLAAQVGAKPQRKLLVSEAVKAAGLSLGTSLRLGPEEVAFAESVAAEVVSATTETESEPSAAAAPGAEWGEPGEYLVASYLQFQFRVPRHGYLFSENDVWVRRAGERARIGISDYLQQQLTDILYVDSPPLGTTVEQFGEVGAVESSKAIFEIVAPVSGVVTRVNEALVERPELVNEDPYDEGWLVELELTAWPYEVEFLLDGATYAETLGAKAADADAGTER
jgi:glycine cleavage system H protein